MVLPRLPSLPNQIVTRVLLNKPTYIDNVNQSPYFAGIIFGSIIWVVFCWLTRLVSRESARILFIYLLILL